MAFMAFLPEIAAASGEAAAGGAVAAESTAAGAEAAGAETASAADSTQGAGRTQNFQQGRQQGQGATSGEIMGDLHQRAESGME
jgi:long-subunit fatty acid transport protein